MIERKWFTNCMVFAYIFLPFACHLRKNEYPRKPPPSFYLVTNNSKERPDVWIDSPEKSIIISITSDIRTVKSEVFAAPYGLRFPRIDRVRYDKPWHECLNVQNFVELVNASNGTTQSGKDYGNLQSYESKRHKHSRKGEKSHMSVVPCHLLRTDVSSIKGDTKIFSGIMFYFVNAPSSHSIDSLHKLVVENGGKFSMNLNNSVTYSVAAESRGIKYQAAKLHGDVIRYSWVLECCAQKKLLQLQPKYFLFLSGSSKKKLQENIDEYSDSYYMDLDIPEVKQLLSNIERSEDPNIVDHYIQKYSPEERWFRFHNYSLYFHLVIESPDLYWEVVLKLAVRRMILDILMSGGKVSNSLSLSTHLVVLSLPGADIDFNIILRSLSESDRYLVQHRRLPVVSFQWLEDCLLKNQKLPEDPYTIISHGWASINEKGKQETCSEESSDWDGIMRMDQSSSTIRDEQGAGKLQLDISRFDDLPKKDNKRKKDECDSLSSKKMSGISQARHKQPRYRKGLAKISEIECETLENKKDPIDRSYELVERENLEVNENEMGQESGSTKVIPKARFMRRPQGVGKRTAKISESESGDDFHLDGRMDEESGGDGNHGFHVVETPGSGARGSDEGGMREKHEKVEVMVDPVQALLFDMVPSLGSMQKDAATPHLSSTNNTCQKPEPVDTTHGEPEPADTTSREPETVKKKKVSYRDVADELLKDW